MTQATTSSCKNFLENPISWLHTLWKFSRPHTIIGTTLSVISLYLIALATTQTSPNLANAILFLEAWIPCLGGNLYIVGLNQLEDVAIDKVNKPNLPLASGEFSQKQGQIIVTIAGMLALGLAAFFGQWLLATVSLSLLIGTAYSLPPIRLKRFPLFAALSIFTVRGIIVNLGLFLYFIYGLTGQSFLPPTIIILTLFILFFSIAIAIFKDVPDIEGDQQYNITTFTLLLGKQAIFNFSRVLISLCYVGMILAGVFKVSGINHLILIISHLCLLGLLWWRSQKVNLEDREEIASFYQFIWQLFFLEYLLFPLTCF